MNKYSGFLPFQGFVVQNYKQNGIFPGVPMGRTFFWAPFHFMYNMLNIKQKIKNYKFI